jgi:hypothetical protein
MIMKTVLKEHAQVMIEELFVKVEFLQGPLVDDS